MKRSLHSRGPETRFRINRASAFSLCCPEVSGSAARAPCHAGHRHRPDVTAGNASGHLQVPPTALLPPGGDKGWFDPLCHHSAPTAASGPSRAFYFHVKDLRLSPPVFTVTRANIDSAFSAFYGCWLLSQNPVTYILVSSLFLEQGAWA